MSDDNDTAPQNLSVGPNIQDDHDDNVSTAGSNDFRLRLLEMVQGRSPNEILDMINPQINPFYRLPTELGALIFQFATAWDRRPPNEVDTLRMNQHYMQPIWLASVCRSWRRIALAEPRLWTTIYIANRVEFALLGRKNWTPSVELVEQWLSRSRSLPIHVYLSWRNAPESEDKTLNEIVCMLCEECPRWRSLYLNIPQWAVETFFCAIGGLTIDLDCLQVDGFPRDFASLALNAKLRPRVASVFILPWQACMSWSNVTSLSVVTVHLGELFNVVSQAPQLQELKAGFMNITGPGAPPGGAFPPSLPVIAPRLRHLDISFVDGLDFQLFFADLRAPELESLHLESAARPDVAVPLDALQHMLVHPETGNVKLQTLGLDDVNYPIDQLIHLLGGLHGLMDLCLNYANGAAFTSDLETLFRHLTNTINESMDDTDAAPTFLPALEHLYYGGPRTFSWRTFSDLLCAHMGESNESKRSLKILDLNLSKWVRGEDLIDKDTLLCLRDIRRGDLKLRINASLLDYSFDHHNVEYPTYNFLRPVAVYPFPDQSASSVMAYRADSVSD